MTTTRDSSVSGAKAPHSPEAGAAYFVTTHWSVVLTAARSDTTRAAAALEQLCRGTRAFGALEVGEAAVHAKEAAAALEKVLSYRKRAEWGPWENWYRGDWRMNLPALHEDTRRLAAKWAELARLEQP